MVWRPTSKKRVIPLGRRIGGAGGGSSPAVPGVGSFVMPAAKNPLQQRRMKVHPTRSFMQPVVEDLPLAPGRLVFVMFMLTLLFGGMMIKLVMVALLPPVEPRASIRELPVEPGRRGNLYDRNGVLLAATLQVRSLYADPQKILDVTEAVEQIRKVFPELSAKSLTRILRDDKRRFVWLKRRISPAKAQAMIALGVPGIGFRDEYVRIYPHNNLASHVLGGVNVDNVGLAGTERGYDKILRKGEDVRLAIDIRAQEILRSAVKEQLELSGSKAGWGVVMDIPTGEIVALTSLPDFDPNHFGQADDNSRFNRVTLGSYEMGSTFKIFTLAQGIAAGKITPDTLIDARTPISIGRYTIKDYHAKKAILTATEVMRYSSNIGAAKIADMSGPEGQKAFMKEMGMLESINAGIPEIGRVQYPSNWGRVQTFTISFGHGMAVTPLHLIAAVGALADGVYRTPSVLLGGSEVPPRPLYTPDIIEKIRALLRDVVVAGSGRRSGIAGYDIGGKTGTAEKSSGGGYDRSRNLVSFVGVVPLETPKYAVLVMLDEPKKGYETGGLSAAPAVGKFMRDFMVWAGLKPDYAALLPWQRTELKKLRGKEQMPAVFADLYVPPKVVVPSATDPMADVIKREEITWHD